jgi:xylulokinase
MADLLLAIDVGTTNCKAVCFDPQGEIIAAAARSYPTYRPQHGWAEHHAEDWLTALDAALSELGQALGRRAVDLRAAALSGHGPTLVLTDDQGNPLEPCPIWQDQRCLGEGVELLSSGIARDWMGMGPPRTGLAAKLLWAKRHQRASFEATAHALGTKSFVGWWLTGEIATEPTSGPGGDRWVSEVFDYIGFPVEKLPPARPSLDLLGELKPEQAARYGLPDRLPVYLGFNDGASATLGAGAIEPGDACVTLGTNGVARLVLDRPFDLALALDIDAFFWPFVPQRWVVGGMTLTGGSCLSWWGAALEDGAAAFEKLIAEAERSPAGSNGVLFLPFLAGRGTPRPDASAQAAFLGLSMRSTRADLTRAVLEGVALAVHDIFNEFAGLGYAFDQARITGGGARTPLWCQIMADALGRPLTRAGGDAVLGSAIAAAVGSGLYATVPEAAQVMVRAIAVYQPNPARQEVYQHVYQRYRSLAENLGYGSAAGARRA